MTEIKKGSALIKQESSLASCLTKDTVRNKETSLIKEAAQIKQKTYFDVKIETMLPATLTYRVLAEDATQAADLTKNMIPVHVKHRLNGKKDIKLTVYSAGSSMIQFVKNLLGR